MNIGAYVFEPAVILAPMAGVADRPFRSLCRGLGADYAVSEMVTAKVELWHSRKTRTRLEFSGETGPCVIQIAGAVPNQMADAARRAVDAGADIVDINMGCPAKKVCNRLAGSALLENEALVGHILDAVCAAVSVPVTLKMRTGTNIQSRNGVRVANIAAAAGIRALTVHGRTRACAFRGEAEYETIREIKAAVRIPVIANGDIVDGARARDVLARTGADGIMVGRAAQGNPWIFAMIKAALAGRTAPVVQFSERVVLMQEHLCALHEHYGQEQGLRIARKHIGWYFDRMALATSLKAQFYRLQEASAQFDFLAELNDPSSWESAA